MIFLKTATLQTTILNEIPKHKPDNQCKNNRYKSNKQTNVCNNTIATKAKSKSLR